MARRKKARSKVRYPLDVPYLATPEAIRARGRAPMTGFVCSTCGWIYIQAGRSGRRACPKCRNRSLRRYPCASFDELTHVLLSREVEHEDPIGNDVLIRRRFAEAYERFMSRLDDWKTAELLAQDIAGDEPARGLVVKLYRDLKVKRPEEGETSSKRRAAGTRKPRLEELEADRRERERKKVRGLRKGIVRKKFL